MNKMLSIKPDRKKYAKGDSPSGKYTNEENNQRCLPLLVKTVFQDPRYELVCG